MRTSEDVVVRGGRPEGARGGAAALLALVIGAAAAWLSLTPGGAQAEGIEVKTKRVSIVAPPSEKALAVRLARMADAALPLYAEMLGIELPGERFKIYLYGTAEEYEAAEEVRTHGTFKPNLAFTWQQDFSVHMVIQPRTGRPAEGGDAPGMTEALTMHELAHALQYRTVPSYDAQPAWLSEGVADLCSERALAGGDTGLLATHPWYADFFHDVNEALDLGTFIPLERLIPEGTQVADAQERQVRYGTCYALVRWLDAPEAPDRRARFRQYLRECNSLGKDDAVAERVNQRFREYFGTAPRAQGGTYSLVNVERELIASIRKAELYPWQTIYKDVRASDGMLLVESFPGSSAMALSAQPALGPRARINATVTIEEGPGRQADIIFAYRSKSDFMKLAFGSKPEQGWVSLMRWDGKRWTLVAQALVPSEQIAPGVPHKLAVQIDVARLAASIDGRAAFKFTLSDRTIGGGRYGVGTYDGHARFTDISAVNQ